ncbi:pyridoxal-phosphate dependent enzyme, partial [candidate division KSB1 bacterium]|nr:pyridoxal-phosphate dependent enzyme [candidate division KSB1 bacterium]
LISATRLGLKPFAVLRGEEPDVFDGNTLLTAMTGAEISYVTEDEYDSIEDVYGKMDHDLRKRGLNPYFIPEGASDELGSWGYISMMEELNEQQKKLNLEFDSMFVALGSGGTQAGILLGKYMTGNRVDVYGINVFKKTRNLYDYIKKTCEEAIEIYALPISFDENDITIISDYIGEGYAKTTDAEMQVILETARNEAIYLDPVYTGKAFYGMVDLLKKYPDRFGKRILFVHTGGFFALFPERERISKLILNS